ncbi:hypothetical protein SGLAM104S_03079 [Streptomyces glaucescens]
MRRLDGAPPILAARVDSVACDLADLHQVRKAAERIVRPASEDGWMC